MISPSTLSAVAGVTALIGTMKSLIGVGKNIINVTSQFEQTQKALETVTQSAEKGKKLFEDLRKFSFDTTFGVDELANASQQLLNVGVSTSVLQKDLKMLGDLAQGDKNKFQELTSIFSKIQSTGKASAIQLQQLALRGIPINKTLKEMGVTGTASAEQLTEAFEKLTGTGGQFHDAMNNIIDTIEGKRGFITDTIKEINVNFGELSGLTEGYKKALDFVYEVVDAVNNKLMEWNENPMTQAIVRGTLVAGITALAVTIGVGLVGAIKTLNKNLAITATLKAIINPTAVALAVGVGAITGLAVALESAKSSANEYYDTVKKVDELKDKYGVGDVNMKNARTNVQKGKASTKEQLAVAVEDLQSSELRKTEYSMQVKNAIYEDVRKNAQADLDYEEEIYKNLKAQVKALQEQLEKEELIASKTQTREEYYQEMTDNFTAFTKKLGDAYTKYSDVAKKEKELKDLVEERAKLVADFNSKYFGLDDDGNAIKLELDPESKRKYEKDLEAINDKYKVLEIDVKVSSQKDWQKKLQSAFGFTNYEVANKNATASTTGALNYFQTMTKQMNDLYSKYGMDSSKYSDQQQYYNSLQSAFDVVLESVREGTYTGTEESLNQFAEAVKKAKDAITPFTTKLEEWTKKQIQNGNVAGGIAGTFAGNMLASSNDVGNFANGFAQGGLIGGIAGAVGGALSAVANEVEGMDRVMNPLTDALRTLTPLFELLVGVMKPIFATLDGIKDVLHAIVEGILRPFEPLIRLISGLFEKLANVITKMYDSVQPIIEIVEMLVDTVLNGINALLEPILQGFQAVGEFLKIFVELSKPFIQVINVIASLIKLLATPLRFLAKGLTEVVTAISDFIQPLMDKMQTLIDWVDEFLGYEKETNDAKKDELERQRALADAYSNMLTTLREVQEEYEKRKKYINAQGYADSVTGVHDMILTPQGKFSTDPDDYIIATKNPKGLNGGKGDIIINNYSNAQVEATQDDLGNTVILISQKVAMDYAQGNNGWESAIQARQARVAGRNLAM